MTFLKQTLMALPAWLRAGRPDLEAAHQRRRSPAYRRRVKRVKTLWLITTLLMLVNPEVSFVLVTGLITSLLSFAILDESD